MTADPAPESSSAGETVLVDVDGTLCWQVPRACEYVREEYGVALAPADVTSWSHPIPGADDHIGDAILAAVAADPEWYLLGMDPLDGAAEAMATLQGAGYDVQIATHRAPETHDLTRQWLAEHDVPYDGLVEHVPENKGALDGDVLVDDYHRNVANALDAGKDGVLMAQPYSDPDACPGAHVARTWDEALAAFSFPGRKGL